MKKIVVLIMTTVALSGCGDSSKPTEEIPSVAQKEPSVGLIVDLTHSFSEETIYFMRSMGSKK